MSNKKVMLLVKRPPKHCLRRPAQHNGSRTCPGASARTAPDMSESLGASVQSVSENSPLRPLCSAPLLLFVWKLPKPLRAVCRVPEELALLPLRSRDAALHGLRLAAGSQVRKSKLLAGDKQA